MCKIALIVVTLLCVCYMSLIEHLCELVLSNSNSKMMCIDKKKCYSEAVDNSNINWHKL